MPEPIKNLLWSPDAEFNTHVLLEMTRILLTGPTAGAFMQPGLQNTVRLDMAGALAMAESMAEEMITKGRVHAGQAPL